MIEIYSNSSLSDQMNREVKCLLEARFEETKTKLSRSLDQKQEQYQYTIVGGGPAGLSAVHGFLEEFSFEKQEKF